MKNNYKRKRNPNRIKPVAKYLSGRDADFMWSGVDNRPGLCSICHSVVTQIPNPEYTIAARHKGDFMSTYDGFDIVSQKFKDFCDANGYQRLNFQELPKSPGYYFFIPEKVYQLDPVASCYQFGKFNKCCYQYYEITKPGPLYKGKDNEIKEDDFICRSSLMFAIGSTKSPLVIIGPETMKKMKAYGLKGIYADDIYDVVPDELLDEVLANNTRIIKFLDDFVKSSKEKWRHRKIISWFVFITILALIAFLVYAL